MPRTSTTTDQMQYFIALHFADGIFRQLKRTFERHGVRTLFRSSITLKNQLSRLKDPGVARGVVYKIPCDQCNKIYIGKTGRPIGKRIKEH